MTVKYIVTLKELSENRDNFIVLDCRADLAIPDKGEKEYMETHIEGAIFVSGDKILSGQIMEHGGRHPFPDFKDFIVNMKKIGISDDSYVVSYGFYSARITLMLRMLGIKASVLSGKIENAVKYGIELNNAIPQPVKGKITGKPDFSMIKDVKYVLSKIDNPFVAIVDSRASERYKGEVEPIDNVAGHIPGALNFFWQEILNENGEFLPLEQLREHFRELSGGKEIIVYCGSGITAAFNWIAMKECGLNAFLYAGSWSDWISYDFTPVKKDVILL